MKRLLLLVAIIALVCIGCSKKENNTSSNNLDDILAKDNYIIVDVRTESEYNEEHVTGAINIPYDQIDSKANLDKKKTILVYCKSGKRSNIAYNSLKELGYDVVDLGAYDTVELDKE